MSVSHRPERHIRRKGDVLKHQNFPNFTPRPHAEQHVTWNMKDGDAVGYKLHPGLYRRKRTIFDETSPVPKKRKIPKPSTKKERSLKTHRAWSEPPPPPMPDFLYYGQRHTGASPESVCFHATLERIMNASKVMGSRTRAWNWSRLFFYRNVRPQGMRYSCVYYDYLIRIQTNPDIMVPSSSPLIRSTKDRLFIERSFGVDSIMDMPGKLSFFAIPPLKLGKVPIVVYISEENITSYLQELDTSERSWFITSSLTDYILWVLRETMGGREMTVLSGSDMTMQFPEDDTMEK